MIIQSPDEEHIVFRTYPCARRALWSVRAFEAVQKARSFDELVPTAFDILECFEEPIVMVSGPITTGGFGSREANTAAMTAAIKFLQSRGESVFDQTPFEEAIGRLVGEWKKTPGNTERYCMSILLDFYRPIFRSGKIAKVAFMDDWVSSFGSSWEHDEVHALGIAIEYLPRITP